MNINKENFDTPKKVGILANHLIPKAFQLGEDLKDKFTSQGSWWLKNINDSEGISENLK